MWLLVAGVLILIIATVLHLYCGIGTQVLRSMAPAIFYSRLGLLLQIGWIALFIIGTVLLFIYNWIVGLISIPIYWLVLPLLIGPSIKRRMLGSWDELKDLLEGRGYNKDNYLNGDWWKRKY